MVTPISLSVVYYFKIVFFLFCNNVFMVSKFQIGSSISLLHKHLSLVLNLATNLLIRAESMEHQAWCVPAVRDRLRG